SRGELVDQEEGQRRNVLPAVAERRQVQRENAQPVVEVLSKGFLAHGLKQVAVRCRQDPHIDPDRSTTADAVEFALLQDAEQFRLGVRGQFADLVEEDRAALGQFESAYAPGDGAGKGTFSWPNSSLSTSPAGRAAQLILISGLSFRRLLEWIARAM